MAGPTQWTQQGLMPAHSPELATLRGVKLPYGGPTDAGGSYAQGLILTNDPGAARPEIWTFTTDVASGTFVVFFVSGAGVAKTSALAYNVSLAGFLAAMEEIFGEDSITSVTGTPGSSYVVTFAWDARIGGKVYTSQTAGSGTITLVRTQRGRCGAGQYDVYDGSTYATTDAILEYETYLDPTGALVGQYAPSPGQPFSPQAYQEGFFFVFQGEDGGDTDNLNLPNIDATAVGAGQKLRKALGAITEAGAIVRLVQ